MQPIGPITDAFRYINYAEAALWVVIGAGFLVRSAGLRGARLATGLLAGVTLLAFGASDVVETRTGAWWHPWWLLAWKGACVLILAGLVVAWRRESRRAKAP